MLKDGHAAYLTGHSKAKERGTKKARRVIEMQVGQSKEQREKELVESDLARGCGQSRETVGTVGDGKEPIALTAITT